MRLTAAKKQEMIRLVEGSDLPVRHTLRELQVPRSTFYTWYRRYAEGGLNGLTPRPSGARRYWNRIPPRVRHRVVDAALAAPERTPRELAWAFTDREGPFLSESSVYRILKAYDLITSPAFVVLSAVKTFAHPTHRPNELWQTDFTYLHVVGWGWYYLSMVLDDYSRYILAWTLRLTMQATDVMETLDLVRASIGPGRPSTASRPRRGHAVGLRSPAPTVWGRRELLRGALGQGPGLAPFQWTVSRLSFSTSHSRSCGNCGSRVAASKRLWESRSDFHSLVSFHNG